jgi:hypothetical protein
MNQLAKRILDEATGDATKTQRHSPKQEAGRKGGLKGGKTRMDVLTEAQRTELAMKGVASRKKAPAGEAGAALVKK